MIDRAPDNAAARAAAAELAPELDALHAGDSRRIAPGPSRDDVELGNQAHGRATPASSPASSSPLGASREHMVALGSLLVLNLSIEAAKRWGEHWVYTEPECTAVATAALDVALLYIDELDGPWWQLAIALGATALPRLAGKKLPPLADTTTPASSAASSPAPSSPAHVNGNQAIA